MKAKELRRIARGNLEGNWMLSVGVTLVASILGGLVTSSGTMNLNMDEDLMQYLPDSLLSLLLLLTSGSAILSIAQLIIGGTVQLGYCKYLLKQYHKETFEFGDLFSQFHRFGQGFAQAFLRGLFTALWTLLFIIPGIVKSFSYAMTPFIMADHPEMSANDAIKESMRMMDGHKLDLFVLDLSFIGWGLLSALTLGIGKLFLNPYINAAHAAFYKSLTAASASAE